MRTLHLLPLAALALTLGACGGTENRGLESVHQAVVSRTNYTYDVPDGMGPRNVTDVQAWVESLSVGYGDRISVDNPTGNTLNQANVASIAARYGLIVDSNAPVTNGAIPAGMFRVVLTRAKAEVPGCPDWSRSSIGNFKSDAPSNYGCATNASLAAMIANPDDLVSGEHAETFSDNSRGTNAIRKMKTPK